MDAHSEFLYPYSHYHRTVKPETTRFDTNLQEFGYRVSILSSLATGGKLPLEDAFQTIEQLWEQLTYTKQQLTRGDRPFLEDQDITDV